MIKKLILPVLALLAITSCSSDELLQESPNPSGQPYISFNTVVNKNTRGVDTNAGIMQKDANGFKVDAFGSGKYYIPESNAICPVSSDSESEDTGFYLTDNYYWPSFDLTFNAWYPASAPVTYDNNGVHSIANYTVPTLENQQDIVVAVGTEGHPSSYTKAMNLEFRHIFSQIIIRARIADEDKEDMKIVVEEAALRAMPSKGSFSFPSSTLSTGNTLLQSCWTPVKPVMENGKYSDGAENNCNLSSYIYKSYHSLNESNPNVTSWDPTTGYVTLNTYKTNGSQLSGFMVIPQDLKDFAWDGTKGVNGAYIALLVKIEKKVNGNLVRVYPHEKINGSEYDWVAIPVFQNSTLQNMQPGMRYIIDLTFTADGAGKRDPDEEDGGDDIFGKPIWFTVASEAWTDVNAGSINTETGQTEEEPEITE